MSGMIGILILDAMVLGIAVWAQRRNHFELAMFMAFMSVLPICATLMVVGHLAGLS